MNRSRRIAIRALVAVSAVCGVLAVVAHTLVLAAVAACCAIFAVAVGLPRLSMRAGSPASAVRVGYGPTTSATVDILELPRPMAHESADFGGHEAALPSEPGSSLYEPVPGPSIALTPQATGALVPAMPVGCETRDVVASLLIAAKAAGDPISAHLWLEDTVTDTFRLVEAQGKARPQSLPVSRTAGLLGAAIQTGTAHLGQMESAHPDERRWRYALPLGCAGLRGVAAVDFDGSTEPDRATLRTVSAALRASLSGALALHVARLEGETARLLVETCAALARVLDPDDVLHTALDQAMELASAQTGSIMLLDPASRRMRIAVARGLPHAVVESTDIAAGDGIAGWVLASRQPLVIEDLKEAGIRSRRHGIRSAVCIPLADEQGIVGVLNVGSTSFLARISKSHLQTLDALGSTIVAALRSAWRSEGAEALYFDTLKALALALEARSPYSRGGIERMLELADAVGARLGVSRAESKALRIAVMLHDAGMSAVGTNVPVSSAPLSTVEWGMLKMHPVIAAEILSGAPALSSVVPIVYHHHERFDGTGYLAGLAGVAIPLGARVLGVLDAYVAMTSSRPYRATLTHAQALSELEQLAGTQFDPRVVAIFSEVVGVSDGEGLLSS